MSQGVLYVWSSEPDYGLCLLASLYTLRQHYDGPVAVVTSNADQVASVVDHVVPIQRRKYVNPKHVHFELKSLANELTPFDSTVYLDCDTLIAGDISPLFVAENNSAISLVQLADWTTTHTQMRHRILQLVLMGILHPAQGERLIAADTPAVNTGVYAFSRACEVFAEWHATTVSLDKFFIHDELAMTILKPDYPHHILDDRWNRLPRYSNATDAVIWHCCAQQFGAGHQIGKPPPPALALWFDTLNRMWTDNYGKVREWWTGNPRLWGEG